MTRLEMSWRRCSVCTRYHPLFCFNRLGDLEQMLLRNGNVASADEWRAVLEPVVTRYRDLDIAKYFRGGAGRCTMGEHGLAALPGQVNWEISV